MLTVNLPPSLATLRSLSNLLYRRSGQHPDGLPRTRQPIAVPNGTSAGYGSEKMRTPRWGLGYVITTIGPSWEIGTENKNHTQERDFLPGINARVSIPSIR